MGGEGAFSIYSMWNWVGGLTSAQATVFGTTVGAILGFLTLTGGALLNAHLNRRRDKALHLSEQLNVLRALMIEIAQISKLVRNQIAVLKTIDPAQVSVSVINPAALAIVHNSDPSKLYYLPPETIQPVTAVHFALLEHEYNAIAHGMALKQSVDGKFRSFNLAYVHVPKMIELNERLDEHIQKMLAVVYPVVERLEKLTS
ncbi:hypothetical protein [Agrobacterium deltaense]|uniref:hypothetical protein n=1 Tax=Agrobacterium deltaense TaxID=1183412 RepID=UPI001C6EFA85|nr:hypothetical protein [Agrobacterium deltaense]MBW9072190.1 hypothetical protein [Agrobacterium deltaense]